MVVLDGELAVPCDPQTATAGLNPHPRFQFSWDCVALSGVEGRVLRGRSLRTPPGPEGSNGKWSLLGAVG